MSIPPDDCEVRDEQWYNLLNGFFKKHGAAPNDDVLSIIINIMKNMELIAYPECLARVTPLIDNSYLIDTNDRKEQTPSPSLLLLDEYRYYNEFTMKFLDSGKGTKPKNKFEEKVFGVFDKLYKEHDGEDAISCAEYYGSYDHVHSFKFHSPNFALEGMMERNVSKINTMFFSGYIGHSLSISATLIDVSHGYVPYMSVGFVFDQVMNEICIGGQTNDMLAGHHEYINISVNEAHNGVEADNMWGMFTGDTNAAVPGVFLDCTTGKIMLWTNLELDGDEEGSNQKFLSKSTNLLITEQLEVGYTIKMSLKIDSCENGSKCGYLFKAYINGRMVKRSKMEIERGYHERSWFDKGGLLLKLPEPKLRFIPIVSIESKNPIGNDSAIVKVDVDNFN